MKYALFALCLFAIACVEQTPSKSESESVVNKCADYHRLIYFKDHGNCFAYGYWQGGPALATVPCTPEIEAILCPTPGLVP